MNDLNIAEPLATKNSAVQSDDASPENAKSFFKQNVSELTLSVSAQIIDNLLTATQIYARFSQAKTDGDDQEMIICASIMLSRFVKAYSPGSKIRRDPALAGFLQALLYRDNYLQNGAINTALLRWFYQFIFAFADFLSKLGRATPPSLKTLGSFLLYTACDEREIFENIRQKILLFPETVNPYLYGHFVILLLSANKPCPSDQEALKVTCSYIENTLVKAGIYKELAAAGVIDDQMLKKIAGVATKTTGKKPGGGLLQAAYAYRRIKMCERVPDWYPDNLIEMLIEGRTVAGEKLLAGLSFDDPETARTMEKAISLEYAPYILAICRNINTPADLREKLFHRAKSSGKDDDKTALEILNDSPYLIDRLISVLTDREVVDLFNMQINASAFAKAIVDENQINNKFFSEKLFIRALHIIRCDREDHCYWLILCDLKIMFKISENFSPAVGEQAFWQFRGYSYLVDELLACYSWSSEDHHRYFSNHSLRNVTGNYYRENTDIPDSIFKEALFDREFCATLITNKTWAVYLDRYFG